MHNIRHDSVSILVRIARLVISVVVVIAVICVTCGPFCCEGFIARAS
jgi:hypothetical protein